MKRIIVICLLCALLAACVPTPEQEFVTHKDTDEMLAKAAEPVEEAVSFSGGTEEGRELPEAPHIRARYAIPERLMETVTEADGHFVVDIDAPVEVPDVAAIPIIRVERGTFTQDEVTRLFNALTKGRTLYHNSQQRTKAQLAEAIACAENELNDPALRSRYDADEIAQIEENVQQEKTLWLTAPDELNESICDGTIGTMELQDDGKTYIRSGFNAVTRDDLPALLFHLDIPHEEEISEGRLSDCILSFRDLRSDLAGMDIDIKIPIIDPENPVELSDYAQVTYTPAQAMADAETFFCDAGFPKIKADTITFLPSRDGSAYGYKITCVRETAGVRGVNLFLKTGGARAGQYAPSWQYERIELCIDAQGVYKLVWSAPLCEKETVLEQTNLLPFNDIAERFRQQLWVEKGPWLILDESTVIDEDYPSDMRIDVCRVTLSLQRVMEKNKFDSGLLIPVWNFWGTTVTTRKNVKTRATYEECKDASLPIVSINAIDGSIIDLTKGY